MSATTEALASAEDRWFGRMNDPVAAGSVTGPCGDTMEFHLVIEHGVITDVRYWTDGCENTRRCGRHVAQRAYRRPVEDALCISAGEVILAGAALPGEGRHCAILAVTTLYRALADYLLAS